MNTEKYTGKVKFFNATKGFGFIVNNEDHSEIFYHVSKIKGIEPAQGNDVEYSIGEGKQGKGVAAIDVTVV